MTGTVSGAGAVVLYSYWRSSCSWRVRAALAFKGIEYEYKAVNLLQNEQQYDAYLAENPAGLVPSLKIGNHTVTESFAIMQFLEEKYPSTPSLLPTNAFDRAAVRSIALQIIAGIQPVQNMVVLKYIGKDKSQEWAQHWIASGFKTLETMLNKTAGKYAFGDSVTIADMCIVPQVYNARRFGLDLSAYPTIVRIDAALMELPAFINSHPRCQPDTPEGERSSQ